MRRTVLLLLLSTIVYYTQAQTSGKLSLSGMGGYVFRDNVSFSNAYGYIEDGAQYGIDLEYFVHPARSIELSYRRMDTKAPIYDDITGLQLNKDKDNIGISYVLLGGVNYFPNQTAATPYGGIHLGVGFVNSKDGGDSFTKFAWDAKLGVKIKVAPSLALKLQAQVQSIVQGAGGGLYISTAGTGLGVTTYSSVYQFGLTGGLAIGF